MRLSFDTRLADDYTSQSQKIRVMSESWVDQVTFCPNCGENEITQYPNGRPVADFYCAKCSEDYELKSKVNSIGSKIIDGAYGTMIERLQSAQNPNFFLLSYHLPTLTVTNFLVIPKHFFTAKIIEQRKPLAVTAQRAGWIGCNILLNHIPETGKIFLVRDGDVVARKVVLDDWQKTLFLRDEKKDEAKGWLLDIMQCIDKLKKREFVLDEVYKFAETLQLKHPENHHVKDKIRQQLQILRDRDYLEFTGSGGYLLR